MDPKQKLDMEQVLALQERIEANEAFLRNYLLDSDDDQRPAEGRRLDEILLLAEETENMLTLYIKTLSVTEETKKEKSVTEVDDDLNLEYKTHEVGRADGEDNIEGDWEIAEEDVIPEGEEKMSSPKGKAKKAKKAKKDKKKDKKKNKKKAKKDKKNKEQSKKVEDDFFADIKLFD